MRKEHLSIGLIITNSGVKKQKDQRGITAALVKARLMSADGIKAQATELHLVAHPRPARIGKVTLRSR